MKKKMMKSKICTCTRVSLVILTASVIFIGVYLAFFNHADPKTTLQANMGSRNMEYKVKADVYLHGGENLGKFFSGNNSDTFIKSSGDFDWDKYVEDNNYVPIGDIYTNCDSEETKKLSGKVLLMEDPDEGGLKTALIFNVTWETDMDFGTIFATVTYDGAELYNNKFPLCTVDPELFVCPLPKGPAHYRKDVHIPGYVPKGEYTTKAHLIDPDGKMIICAECVFKNM